MVMRMRIIHPDGRAYKVLERDYRRLYAPQGFRPAEELREAVEGGPSEHPALRSLETLSRDQLRELAKAAQVRGYSRMNRQALIEALRRQG